MILKLFGDGGEGIAEHYAGGNGVLERADRKAMTRRALERIGLKKVANEENQEGVSGGTDLPNAVEWLRCVDSRLF